MIKTILYLLIGVCLSCYWWDKTYKKAYNEAKESKEGAEEGMASILLILMTIFWPILLVRNLYKYKHI